MKTNRDSDREVLDALVHRAPRPGPAAPVAPTNHSITPLEDGNSEKSYRVTLKEAYDKWEDAYHRIPPDLQKSYAKAFVLTETRSCSPSRGSSTDTPPPQPVAS